MASAHQSSLTAKHRTLEERIAAETVRPRPDEGQIREWKRQKQRIKEAIAGLPPDTGPPPALR